MARDPVCGMEVDEKNAATRARFDGDAFLFCSEACKSAFEQAPAAYVRLMRQVPAGLRRLPELARNLWWSWHPAASALFEALAESSGDPGHLEPVRILRDLTAERWEALAGDREFLARYQRVLASFDADVAVDRGGFWAGGPTRALGLVAYFSAEFGLHSSLPVYSGGLGVLAGDIAKEASDLRLPLVGVGFMYPEGYFRQRVAADGHQEERYERLDRSLMPAEPACVEEGRSCVIALQLPDRALHVAVWLVRAGRMHIYLMSTDLEANTPWDREVSARLYGGDQEMRIRQEILLGIGGVRLLRALGIAPAVWHANEGHAALMMVERVRELVQAGRPVERAIDKVRASTVFTTHTPVAAGHDVFPFSLVEKYLAPYWPDLALDRDRFLALGADPEAPERGFNMTALALRLSGHRNGVSRRHGEVSRRMWQGLWPGVPEAQVPIGVVTNGVHLASWLAPELDRLYCRHLGDDWRERHDDPRLWEGLAAISDHDLWQAHRALKSQLIAFLRERARRRWALDHGAASTVLAGGALLDPEALTLGFARRFATYKRATLILRDPTRLRRILTDRSRPVQIVFAGKAHPADEPAKRLLHAIYGAASDPDYEGRIVFVEDYDMHVAAHFVQGVDVWVNTPLPPLEASGTSGQKAAINGIPNLSVLDGWWAEAYDGTNGWAIGEGNGDLTGDARDAADAESLYRALETEAVPRYYLRGADEVPTGWLRLMRRAIATVTPQFTARRMVKDYVERLYVPALGSDSEVRG